ncbi:hypothetical protein INT43_004738 [Umbelopsis isabellina]|uniref:Uncharacterized protein n=1 Tax=Mortierella isabellina TaxID=91625 RepID=A0A8H7UBB8_MORIS|nr:hypothetical protein INT43_004738 [Umbelopsis isabellina]
MSTKTEKPQSSMGGSTERKSLFNRDGKKSGGLQLFQDTNGGGDMSNSETTGALRIDLNLEAQITVKARIHGDLTLALEM